MLRHTRAHLLVPIMGPTIYVLKQVIVHNWFLHVNGEVSNRSPLLENTPNVQPKSTGMKVPVHLHTGTFRVDGTYG